MPKYISGRYKKTPQSALTADRYRYLSPGDAEPNLGDSPSNQGSPNLPTGQQFIVVSFIDRPGERFWIPNQGGIIPGSLSIFEEGTLVGGLSSTTQLNFVGQSITAQGVGGANPGVAVTLTVAPPGNLNEVLFVGAGGTDFDTDTRFTFNNGLFAAGDRITVGTGGTVITTTGIGSVGIGTTNPTQKLHLNGDFRITGTIYDSLNQPGDTGDLIVKTATGGLSWVAPKSVISGAGGTIGQIQYHNTAGLVDGASNFYYDFNNNRVGIGSTQPTQLLDVLGVSTFKGGVFVDDLHTDTLNVSGVSTIPKISGIVTFNNQTNNIIGNSNTGAVQIDGGVGIDKNLTVGAAITTQNLGVSGIATVQTLDVDTIDIENLNVAGISTLGNVIVNTNTISTKSGTGNLVIDSDASVNIKDPLIVSGQTESINKDSGSLVVEGGIGVEKSVNIGLNLDVDGNTELDTLNVSVASTTASLTVGTGVAVTTILDEDDMSSNSDTALATQQSIKTYIDNQTTAQDLDFAGDSGSGSVDLDSQTLTISGTTNEIETSASNQTLTIGLPNNVTVSGNLTVNGNTTLGDNGTDGGDTVIFGSRISSNILPNANNAYDLGSTDRKWDNVYATTFNGAFQGTADTADKLTTPRQISFGTDVVAIAKTFDGTQNVGFALTLANSGVSAGTYGSSTQVGIVTVDSKGRVTAASNVNINFADATVDIAKKLETARTFTLGEGSSDDIVAIAKTFDGSADVGFALTLKDVGPGSGTYGGDNKLISLALDDKGRVTGVTSTSINFGIANVATADSLTNPRNIAATGDITWNVNFKGHENVTAAATLSNTTVSAGSYGSPTQVGTFTVDTKGRLTAAGNTSINFADATVGNANYAANAGIATNLKGGGAYQIPYQSAANTTQFIPNGSVTGQLLQYNQSSAPSWVSVGEISAGTASTANNLSGGAAGSIPYQTGPGITAFLGEPDADDKVLSYNNSTNAPVWVNSSTIGTDNYVDSVSFSGGTLTLGRTGSLTDLTTTISLAGVGGTNAFTGLTDTPADYNSAGGKLVAVNSGASGLEFVDVSGVGTDNYVDSVSFSGGTLTLGRTGSLPNLTTTITLAGIGGTNAFTGLTDTPADYTNQGGKLVAVNSGADGLEFIDASGVGTSYTLPASGNTSSVTITLTGSDSTTDPVTITAGTGVSFANVSQSGFTINSSGGGGSSDPVGTIVAWAGSVASIPSEYQLCDGTAADTPELAAITGANVPDLRDRFIIGATDGGDGTYPGVGVGSTGGSADAVVVEHQHGAGTLSGLTTDRYFRRFPDQQLMEIDGHHSDDHGSYRDLQRTIEITGSTANEGVSGTNANLPPYYALCYIIKHTATSGSGGVGIGSTTRIIQGNTKAEVVDTGSDGHFFVETEGTERLRITSNGRVGIGTDNPLQKLFVEDSVIPVTIKRTTDAGDLIYLRNNNYYNVIGGDNGSLYFKTNGTAGSNERLRITSNGSVGIGTTNPAGSQNPNSLFATKLDVYKSFVGGGDGSFVGRFYGVDTDVQETSVRFITKGTGGTSADLHNASDAYLMHGISNGDTKFVFGANGNVGIGTTNPTATLDVNGTVALGSSVYDSNGNTGTSGQVLSSVPGIGVSWTDQTGGSGVSGSGTIKVAILSEEQSSGTNGGEFSSGSWLDRTLNTLVDPQSIVTFSSSNNYFALEAGSYKINWSAPAHAVDSHQTKLVYADNTSFTSSSEILGTSEACHDPILEGSNLVQTRSFGETVITITETTYFKVQHRCTDTKSNTGFGVPSNFGVNEVYTQISIQDLSSAGGSGGSGGSSDSVGTIVAWSGSFLSIPSEYQLCDGSAAQTTELQAITGANVPDLRSRFIVGAANTTGIGTYPNVGLGSTGGSADAVVVSHTHDVTNQTGQGPSWIAFSRDDINPDTNSEGNDNTGYQTGTGSQANDRIFNIASQGEDAGNKNLPPYYALFYIIKHTATSGSGGGIELLSPKTATGTSVEFTDIPADAKEITLMFSEVGVGNTTNHLLVQLGTSSSWINTGYYASSEAENGQFDVSASDGFPIHNRNDTDSAGNRFTGSMIINLFKTSPSKTYTQIGQFKRYNTSDDCEDCSSACQTYGNVDSISGDITRIRVLANHTGSGQSFTSGEINVSCNSGGSGGGSLIKHGTVATNTGTEAAFTNIPSTAKKITVAIHNFGFSGNSDDFIMEVGDSSGYAQSGYQSSYDSTTAVNAGITTAYGLTAGTDEGLQYNINVELVNVTGNSWTISHTGGNNTSLGSVIYGGGSISLTNTLDRLRIKTANGRTLDNGHVTVYYETQGGSGSDSGGSGFVLETEKSSATGNSNPIEFTGIPDDAQEITLMFNGVSLSGDNDYLVQLGTSSSYIETGYTATTQNEAGNQGGSSNVGFIVLNGSSAEVHHGKFDINKFSDTAYTFEGQTRRDGGSGSQAYGSLNGVNGTITRLRIKPTGNNNFDAGSINISYKTASSSSSSGSSGDGFVTGMIMMFSGTTAPSGWVLCDNSAEAQAANAPDLRDRFIVGTGNSYNLNATGGSADAALPTHDHYTVRDTTVTSGGGTPGTAQDLSSSNYLAEESVLQNGGIQYELKGTSSASNVAKTSITGSSATNANLPPYYALAFIMKT